MTTHIKPILGGALGLAVALLVWQFAALGPMDTTALPTVTATIDELLVQLSTPGFWMAVALTILISVLGLAGAAVAGIVLGILIGRFEPLRYASFAAFEFLKPIPPIVILPVVVLVLGPTWQMAWVLVFIGCLWPIIMQTMAGVHDTDPVAYDTARSFGMKQPEILRKVVLPSALPFIGTGLRVAVPAALIVTVVAGLLGGGPGLGKSVYLAQAGGQYPTLYALVIVLGVLGLLFLGVARFAESRVLHWHESYREVVQ
ncbi:ABC transporter permease [Arthrobacter pigmenti]